MADELDDDDLVVETNLDELSIDESQFYKNSWFVDSDHIIMVWWMFFTSCILTAGSTVMWMYFYEGYHDTFLWISHLIVYPQNIIILSASIGAVGFEHDKFIRRLASHSTKFAAAGPYILFWLYIVWATCESMLNKDTTFEYIFIKLFSIAIYTILNMIFMT